MPTVGSERKTVCPPGAHSGGADIKHPEVPALRVMHTVKSTGEMWTDIPNAELGT